jgi:AraC-like DNA-binding protein
MEACGILLSILGTYADAFPAKQDDTALGEDPRITTALLLIRSHYHRSYFNVAKLCQLMHCNRVTLHRLFQSELGESPGNYLSAFRIRQACTMLKMGMSVKTTALSCGFEDPFYFSRVFKQQKGCSPSDYKQLHAKS